MDQRSYVSFAEKNETQDISDRIALFPLEVGVEFGNLAWPTSAVCSGPPWDVDG
jgi:hypothetical protein